MNTLLLKYNSDMSDSNSLEIFEKLSVIVKTDSMQNIPTKNVIATCFTFQTRGRE